MLELHPKDSSGGQSRPAKPGPKAVLNVSQAATTALHPRLPLPVVLFVAASLLNEISAQMVATLISILLAAALSVGRTVPLQLARLKAAPTRWLLS